MIKIESWQKILLLTELTDLTELTKLTEHRQDRSNSTGGRNSITQKSSAHLDTHPAIVKILPAQSLTIIVKLPKATRGHTIKPNISHRGFRHSSSNVTFRSRPRCRFVVSHFCGLRIWTCLLGVLEGEKKGGRNLSIFEIMCRLFEGASRPKLRPGFLLLSTTSCKRAGWQKLIFRVSNFPFPFRITNFSPVTDLFHAGPPAWMTFVCECETFGRELYEPNWHLVVAT